MMRVGITGSWRDTERETWQLSTDSEGFKNSCRQIGVAIANTGSSITVGSDSPSTADRYAVEGYLSAQAKGPSVRVIRPQRATGAPFSELYGKYPQAFVYLTGPTRHWRHTRQMLADDVDALVTVGGAEGTYQAGLELRLARKRLVPVAGFGGASARLLSELLADPALRQRQEYERLANPWTQALAEHVVAILGANRPPKILLIHGHAEDRIALKEWLVQQRSADPVVMGQQFSVGQTLPEKFEELAAEAEAAIALATPDDLASPTSSADPMRSRARQNVWVEVGWFWGRLGRNRVMLLVRGAVEIPSDLDGIEYHTYQRSPLELETRIQSFLRIVGKSTQ